MIKARDQLLYYIDLTKPLPKKLQEKAQRCAESGIAVRRFNRLRTQKELKWWIDLFFKPFQNIGDLYQFLLMRLEHDLELSNYDGLLIHLFF